jgi:hypothetical protein
VAMAQCRQHVHDKGFAHTTPGQRTAEPSLDGGVLSVWVPTASRNSVCARRNKGTTPLQGKGARAATTAAAPAKRPARLDGRLSSDGGSARRRGAGQRSTTNSERIRLGPALVRRPGPQQGRGGFSPRVPGHDGEAAVKQRKKTGARLDAGETEQHDAARPAGPAPISRWRLDHGRLRLGRRRPWLGPLRLRSGHAQKPLLRRPRLQAGQRRCGPAARRRPSAAPAGGAAVQLPLPLLFLSPTPSSFIFLHEQRLRDGHGACALRSAFPTSPIFPSSSRLRRSKKENPQGASRQGRRRILGPKSPRRRSTGRTGAVEFIVRRPRVLRLESGRRGCGVGARGSIRRASATGRWPWGAAWLASPPAPLVTVGNDRGRKKRKCGGKRRADRRVPHVSGCGVWLVVSGLAGCVGPKGLVGCGLGKPEEGFEVV